MKNNDWEKCFKLICHPPLEVYKDFINFFGENITIENLDRRIVQEQSRVDFLQDAKEIWEKEFKSN